MNNRMRHVLAYSFHFCAGLPAVAVPAVLLIAGDPKFMVVWEWSYLPFVFIMVITLGALAGLLGLVFVWPVVFRLVSRLNGAPFSAGDAVTILIGPHRNQVVRVYEVWEARGQLRVDLGTEKTAALKDVYAYFQVCRVKCHRDYLKS